MASMTSTADTISRLWTAARALFARLRAAIGETASLAALDAEDVRDIRLWLRTLEAMVRRIVLIEAIALVRRGDATHRRSDERQHENHLRNCRSCPRVDIGAGMAGRGAMHLQQVLRQGLHDDLSRRSAA